MLALRPFLLLAPALAAAAPKPCGADGFEAGQCVTSSSLMQANLHTQQAPGSLSSFPDVIKVAVPVQSEEKTSEQSKIAAESQTWRKESTSSANESQSLGDALKSAEESQSLGNVLHVGGIALQAAHCKEAVCAYGMFICSEMKQMGEQLGYGTQIALFNAGGIDATGDHASFFKLSGFDVEALLRGMLAAYGKPNGGGSTSFLQMVGMGFQATWGDSDEWKIRNIIVEERRGIWIPLDHGKNYSVVSNSDVRGGDVVATGAMPISGNSVPIAEIVKNATSATVALKDEDDRELMVRGNDVLGQTEIQLDGAACLDGTCAYGSLLCDEMRSRGRVLGFDTHIGIYTGGEIDGSIAAGNVTWDELLSVHTDGSLVTFLQIKGGTIFHMLEAMLNMHGAPDMEGNSGPWLQMAGLRFHATWAAATNWTLHEIEVEDPTWVRLNMTKSYSVAANSRLWADRFRSDMLQDGQEDGLKFQATGPAIVKVMADLFKAEKVLKAVPTDDRHCLTSSCSWLEKSLGTRSTRSDSLLAACAVASLAAIAA